MPRITRKKILEKVAQLWPKADATEITGMLDGCGRQARVQLAVLKLCEGDREQLPRWVEAAKRDWRDVIAYAEYPKEMRTGPVELRAMSPEDKRALRERDRAQYLEWLGG